MTTTEERGWEKEFDEKFGNYGMVSTKELGMLEEEVGFRLNIKSFIKSVIEQEKALEAERVRKSERQRMVEKFWSLIEKERATKFLVKRTADEALRELQEALTDKEEKTTTESWELLFDEFMDSNLFEAHPTLWKGRTKDFIRQLLSSERQRMMEEIMRRVIVNTDHTRTIGIDWLERELHSLTDKEELTNN